MSLSKIAIGVGIICAVALTVFIWMPLFLIGGLFGVASSLFLDGSHWYGRLYADRLAPSEIQTSVEDGEQSEMYPVSEFAKPASVGRDMIEIAAIRTRAGTYIEESLEAALRPNISEALNELRISP